MARPVLRERLPPRGDANGRLTAEANGLDELVTELGNEVVGVEVEPASIVGSAGRHAQDRMPAVVVVVPLR